MNVCEQCGSASRDMSGICAGCGAAWHPATPLDDAKRSGSRQPSPQGKLSAQIGGIALPDVHPKNVWVAVLLALVCGPLGLLYCTATGALVMAILSMVATTYLGYWAFLIVPLACAIWAWKAARESSSIFD